METTKIDPQNGKKGKKGDFAGTAATGAAGIIAGIAGTTLAQNLDDEAIEESSVIDEDTREDVQEVQPEAQEQAAQTSPSANGSGAQESVTSDASQVEAPQPITSENNIADMNSAITPETQQSEVAQDSENSSISVSEEPVNPEEIAEAIISEEQIDPNDIDMADVVNFDEIGSVYTVDGESYTAATFHDAAGNQLVMVDVDGDNTFDVVTDMEGNVIADANNMTVDDAEIGISDDNTYLASNELDSTSDFNDSSITDDLLA